MAKCNNNFAYLLLFVCVAKASSLDLSVDSVCTAPEDPKEEEEWSVTCNAKAQTWMKTNYGIVYDDRPAWIDDDKYIHLEREMQIAHYGTAGRNILDICHRLSWLSIRCILDALFEKAWEADQKGYARKNYDNIYRFVVTDLGDRDPEAIVNLGRWNPPYSKTDFQSDKWWENWIKKRHGDQYLTPALIDGIEKLQKRVKDILDQKLLNFYGERNIPNQRNANIQYMREILRIANSMPANLRYGPGGTNSAVGKCFDPMGNMDGELTTQEKFLIKQYWPFMDMYFYSQNELNMTDIPSRSPLMKDASPPYQLYFRSTTGFYETYNTPTNNFWYMIGIETN